MNIKKSLTAESQWHRDTRQSPTWQVAQPQESCIHLFYIGHNHAVLSHWVSAGSRGPFGHEAEPAAEALGNWTTSSWTSEDEDETNGHFTSLRRVKPQRWTYKFILCLLCGWMTAKSLICCPQIVVCIIRGALNFPLKHDTAALSRKIKQHNDISSISTASHFSATLVIQQFGCIHLKFGVGELFKKHYLLNV